MKIFLTLFIIFIFFPIPLKFYIYYNDSNYHIKLYNLTLFNNSILKKKKEKMTQKKNNPPNNNKLTRKYKILKILKNKKTLNYFTIKGLIHKFYNLKFKPFLILNCKIDYSFADAAKTAIAYGSLCTLPPIIYFFIGIAFNIKKYDFKIVPVFKDKLILKLEARSIIFISLVNIIYMILIFLIYMYFEIKKDKINTKHV